MPKNIFSWPFWFSSKFAGQTLEGQKSPNWGASTAVVVCAFELKIDLGALWGEPEPSLNFQLNRTTHKRFRGVSNWRFRRFPKNLKIRLFSICGRARLFWATKHFSDVLNRFKHPKLTQKRLGDKSCFWVDFENFWAKTGTCSGQKVVDLGVWNFLEVTFAEKTRSGSKWAE